MVHCRPQDCPELTVEAVDYVIPASATDVSNATGPPAAMVALVLDASAPAAALEALQAAMLQARPSVVSVWGFRGCRDAHTFQAPWLPSEAANPLDFLVSLSV